MHHSKFPSPHLVIPPVLSARQKGYLLHILERLDSGDTVPKASVAELKEARVLARSDRTIFHYQSQPVSELHLLNAYIDFRENPTGAEFPRLTAELRARMGYRQPRAASTASTSGGPLANLPVILPPPADNPMPPPSQVVFFSLPVVRETPGAERIAGADDIARYSPEQMAEFTNKIREDLQRPAPLRTEYFHAGAADLLDQWISRSSKPAETDPYFVTLPWSGAMSIDSLLRACCSLSISSGRGMVANREKNLNTVRQCLLQAVKSWNEEKLLHDETFRALQNPHPSHAQALSPLRLVSAVRSLYLRTPQEAKALQNALGRCFDHEPRDLSSRVGEITGWLSVLDTEPDSVGITPGLGLRTLNFLIPAVGLRLTSSQCNSLSREILREGLSPGRAPLPEIIRRFNDGLESLPISDPLHRADRNNIDYFMNRVPETIWHRNEPAQVHALLVDLRDAMNRDPGFAKSIAQVAETYAVTCDDNILLGLDKMRMLLKMHRACGINEKLECAKLMHQYSLIEQAARRYGDINKDRRDPATGRIFELDLVEIALHFLTALRVSGDLADGGYRLFSHGSPVTRADIEALKRDLKKIDQNSFHEYLAQEPWLHAEFSASAQFNERAEKIDADFGEAMELAFSGPDAGQSSLDHLNAMNAVRDGKVGATADLIRQTLARMAPERFFDRRPVA